MIHKTNLFTPITLGDMTLTNRVVMAPLTRNRAGRGNVVQEMTIEYYKQRAMAGLIITEASQVSAQGVGYPATPGIHTQDQIDGWQRVTEAVHANGGRIYIQLWHVGRISHPSMQPDGALPVAPSAIKPDGEAVTYDGMQAYVTPRSLDQDELPGIVQQFRQAAVNAMVAGFDGVEIHAANGYLIDQFMRDGSNQRSDGYGGSLENRTRLLREVTEAVVDVWGEHKVAVRISPANAYNSMSDSDPQTTFNYVAKILNQYKLAFLHVVETGLYGKVDAHAATFDFNELRNSFSGLYMANGGYDKARAEKVLTNDSADLVSFGALFISNPDLPLRLELDAELNMADESTFYGGDEKGYIDYPFYQV